MTDRPPAPPAAPAAVDLKHHLLLRVSLFALAIGVLAGLFGIGAGWANVPALNLLMGAPLKVSAGTSGLVLSLVDSSAAWVYINKGAVLPMIAVFCPAMAVNDTSHTTGSSAPGYWKVAARSST